MKIKPDFPHIPYRAKWTFCPDSLDSPFLELTVYLGGDHFVSEIGWLSEPYAMSDVNRTAGILWDRVQGTLLARAVGTDGKVVWNV